VVKCSGNPSSEGPGYPIHVLLSRIKKEEPKWYAKEKKQHPRKVVGSAKQSEIQQMMTTCSA